MESVIFTNSKGASLEIGDLAPYILYKIDGTGGNKADIKMQKSPFQQGKTHLDTLLDYRPITLEITIITNNEEEQFKRRKELSSIFNPLLKKGKLKYKYDGGEKEIDAVLESAPIFKVNPEGPIEQLDCLINLLAPEPFWKDTYITSEEMSYLLGGISFELSLPTKFSERSFKRKLINNGDAETSIKIEFYGPASNPVVKNNSTGKFIMVKRELDQNDILYIDTSFGNKKVEILREDGTKENAFNYIDLESTFFNLQLGENEIEYNSNNDSKKTKVIVKYRNRYVGV